MQIRRRKTDPDTIPILGGDVLGACCDRCNYVFLIRKFPHSCLCPSCFLATLTPQLRAKLLGTAKAGINL